MSLFDSIYVWLFYTLPVILIVLLIVYRCISKEKRKHGLKIALIVVGVLQVCVFLYMFYSFMNCFEWQTQEDLSDVEIGSIAEDYYLIPELATYIESVSERGFRDYDYIYETRILEKHRNAQKSKMDG